MSTDDRIFSSNLKEEDLEFEMSLRPVRLEEFIGQAKTKENLSVFIEAAKKRQRRSIMFFSSALPDSEKQHSLILSPKKWAPM